ncbi:hypothetical protein EGK_08927 [Macaca mulatta]|uniref:Uncharacterized protein n=2 Tax=Macaca TaxID=9539 RepID=F6UYY0_MACMU|nr:hypothetical protein EGK_08927 [Macaca mulatta]EHH58300.1 hypothetical protein EGM_08118 [Macaca fascicularis]
MRNLEMRRLSKTISGFLTYRNCEMINVCYLKPQSFWGDLFHSN